MNPRKAVVRSLLFVGLLFASIAHGPVAAIAASELPDQASASALNRSREAARAAMGAALAFQVGKQPAKPRANQPVAVGAWIPDAPWNIARLDEYAAMVGGMPAVVLSYQDWVHDADFPAAYMSAVHARGAMPLVTWEPWDYTQGASQPAFALASIASGAHDEHLQRYARAAAAWRQPFYLRFAHEMNTPTYPWAASAHGNTPGDYVAAWRHVHDIFQQEGATNARWVWSPNVEYDGTTPFAEVYPGDDYVDWIALDGYNGGTALAWGGWLNLAEVFASSYDALTLMTNKPLMIAETATTELGGNKAEWITRAFLTDLPSRFPRIRAVIWFNENKETDWRVNSSAPALAAWQQVVATPGYRGMLP